MRASDARCYQAPAELSPRTARLSDFNQRVHGCGRSQGLAVEGLIDLPGLRAGTEHLSSPTQVSSPPLQFCSCGCGMIAAVREGKLISMEGDYNHVVNRGSLCVKSISRLATHKSPKSYQTTPPPLHSISSAAKVLWQSLIWICPRLLL
jgi:hypothetical protein